MDSDKCLLPRPRTSKFPTKQQRYMSNPLDSPCTSAYSKTTGNCQDSSSSSSSSPSSSSDQSYNADNASGLGMRAMKKRRQAAHSHKLSYKKRCRDNKFNKRMRALRNLIPNCSKLDKESVLDEAIEYVKTLQLQLQIMSTFAGLCAPPTPILFPTLGSVVDLRLRASGLQLFGLPLPGYGTRLQMPMNALPAEQP